MAIGIKGLWSASINGDEIDSDEMRMLNIEEIADLSLPTAHLQFRTHDITKVKKYVTPGYKVQLHLDDGGAGGEGSIDANFVVFKKKLQTYQGNDEWLVDTWLILDNLDYYNKHRMETYSTWSDKKKSSEVVSQVASRVGLTPKVKSSSDKMLWIQHNTPDRRFLEEVVYHGWFGEKQPVGVGIKKNKDFIYKPVGDLLTKKFKIGDMDDCDIKVNEYNMTISDGFLSSWVGKERITPTRLHEEGIDTEYDIETTPLIAQDTGLYDTVKYAPIGWQNDNVHENWFKAESQNIQFRASLSSMSMSIGFHGQFRDMSILDCFEGLWKQAEGTFLKELSGLWLATKVSHRITTEHYTVVVTLSRERSLG